jgi:hypothetical protein
MPSEATRFAPAKTPLGKKLHKTLANKALRTFGKAMP